MGFRYRARVIGRITGLCYGLRDGFRYRTLVIGRNMGSCYGSRYRLCRDGFPLWGSRYTSPHEARIMGLRYGVTLWG